MGSKPRLTAVQRKGRKEIKALIQDARRGAMVLRMLQTVHLAKEARLLDDLADVAQKYLEVTHD